MVTNRVLLTLLAAGLLAAGLLPMAAVAPNRLVSGQPVGIGAVLSPGQAALALVLAGAMALAALRRPFGCRAGQGIVLGAAYLLLVVLMVATGDLAARAVGPDAPSARVGLGSAFWTLVFCLVLAAVDALQRLGAGMAARIGYALLVAGTVAALFMAGSFDQLSIMREYAARRDVFANELTRHILLVLGALAPSLVIGVPLGLLALRRPALRGGLFATLNVFQTIPSMALFGLLVAPLSALSDAVPMLKELGVQGIGVAPALIALVLYALLPVVRNTYAGFAGIPAGAIEAARGMGMTAGQILWRVELPLALPVLLSGLRIVTVQAIGLTVVAALIGAGGLGSFIFQGLGQYAIDLVLLGAVPTIVLAVTADFLLQVLIAVVRPGGVP